MRKITDHHRGEKRQQNRAYKTAGLRASRQTDGYFPKTREVNSDDGQDRTELDDDFEDVSFRSFKAENLVHQKKMPCRGYRQKLGQAFDKAHDGCIDLGIHDDRRSLRCGADFCLAA